MTKWEVALILKNSALQVCKFIFNCELEHEWEWGWEWEWELEQEWEWEWEWELSN